MSVVRGKDFYLYRNSDDPYDNSPTWNLVENVRDLSRTLEAALADASIRSSTFRLQVSTLLDLSVEWQMVYDSEDADVSDFEDAFFNREFRELLILDGPVGTNGSKGIRGMFQITNFTVNEALEDVGLIDVSAVPGYYPTNLPRRVLVAGGAVTDV